MAISRSHFSIWWLLLPLAAQAAGPRFIDAKAEVSHKWKGRETRTVESLGVSPLPPGALTRFGGLATGKRQATGFFRVEKIGERWWFIDPEGGRFLFAGVCSVRPAAGESFDTLFGTPEVWAAKTVALLRENGFNGCGGFSDHERLRTASPSFPYTVTLGLLSGFGRSLGLTRMDSGHTGYEEDILPVFEPGFAEFCLGQCRERLAKLKEDPHLAGVFSDNELPVREDLLDRMLKRGGASGAAARKFREARGDGEVTERMRQDFVEHVFDTYFRITTTAIREALPAHLCLGSRFHGPAKRSAALWRAAGRWCDVVSMNYYDYWNPQKEHLRQWHEWSGKPCLITEFYVKAMDSGLPNTSGAGWVVKTQADRGAFYQNFALALLESGTCVGWHWFKYQDNDPSNPRADASNRDSNKGILNLHHEPYTPLLEAMRELNLRIYPLVEQCDAAKPLTR